MLSIAYYLSESRFSGPGVFAGEPVPSGARIGALRPACHEFHDASLDSLPENLVALIRQHGHFDPVQRIWTLAFGDAIVIDRSSRPNLALCNGDLIATRAIMAGEELTLPPPSTSAAFATLKALLDV